MADESKSLKDVMSYLKSTKQKHFKGFYVEVCSIVMRDFGHNLELYNITEKSIASEEKRYIKERLTSLQENIHGDIRRMVKKDFLDINLTKMESGIRSKKEEITKLIDKNNKLLVDMYINITAAADKFTNKEALEIIDKYNSFLSQLEKLKKSCKIEQPIIFNHKVHGAIEKEKRKLMKEYYERLPKSIGEIYELSRNLNSLHERIIQKGVARRIITQKDKKELCEKRKELCEQSREFRKDIFLGSCGMSNKFDNECETAIGSDNICLIIKCIAELYNFYNLNMISYKLLELFLNLNSSSASFENKAQTFEGLYNVLLDIKKRYKALKEYNKEHYIPQEVPVLEKKIGNQIFENQWYELAVKKCCQYYKSLPGQYKFDKFFPHLQWNDYFMGLAMLAGKRSVFHEGACIVIRSENWNNYNVIGIGYAGPQLIPEQLSGPIGM